MSNLFDLSKIEIKVKINQKNTMLAQVELFYYELHIYGYRVMLSDFGDGLFIQAPSIRIGNIYKELVRIEESEKWRQLENMIKNSYLQAVADYNAEITGDVEHLIEQPKKKPSAEELLDEMLSTDSI